MAPPVRNSSRCEPCIGRIVLPGGGATHKVDTPPIWDWSSPLARALESDGALGKACMPNDMSRLRGTISMRSMLTSCLLTCGHGRPDDLSDPPILTDRATSCAARTASSTVIAVGIGITLPASAELTIVAGINPILSATAAPALCEFTADNLGEGLAYCCNIVAVAGASSALTSIA